MNYQDYLRSPEWQNKRTWALKWADYRCQVCNSPDRLEVHHRTYQNLGQELPGDLTVLCHKHHKLLMPERKAIREPGPPEPPDPNSLPERVRNAASEEEAMAILLEGWQFRTGRTQ
jgi:hypothetical protein